MCILKSECGLDYTTQTLRNKNRISCPFVNISFGQGGEEKERIFSLKKFELYLCHITQNLSTPWSNYGGNFQIQNLTSVTHFQPEFDMCPRLGLWIWQVSYTCHNSPISLSLGGKFKFWVSFPPSLQNPPIDPSGLSTFESRPISAIGPQMWLGPKTLFVPI